MSFNEEGYLGGEIDAISESIHKEYKDLFDYCYELNSFAQKVKFEFNIHQDILQEIIASCLFVKILNGFQAGIILFKKGLSSEGKIITRTIIEGTFILGAICKDRKLAEQFIETDKAKRLRLINSILNGSELMYGSLKSEVTNEMKISLQKEIEEKNIVNLSAEQWAQKADLNGLYTPYRVLSDDVHPNARTLENYYLGVDNGNNIISIESGWSTHFLSETVSTAASSLLIAVDCMCNMFSLNQGKRIEEFELKLKTLEPFMKHKNKGPF